jgi:hypothetical protein
MIAVLKLLDWIPGWVYLAMFAGAVATSCIQGDRHDREKLAHSLTKTSFAEERAAAARSMLNLSERNRKTEQELNDAKAENELQAAALLEAINRADTVAAVASQRLRDAAQDAADAARLRCAAAGAPGYSTPGADPIGVLADVLGRADQRAGELAAIADRSRVRGLSCEAAYDAAYEALKNGP